MECATIISFGDRQNTGKRMNIERLLKKYYVS